jgi:hypothetical protein
MLIVDAVVAANFTLIEPEPELDFGFVRRARGMGNIFAILFK